MITIVPPSDWGPVDDICQRAGDFDWIAFTSANGVRATLDRMRQFRLDARLFSDRKIAVIGEPTARAVRDLLCIEPDCVPQKFVAEALADELIGRGEVKGHRFVLFRAEIARPVLVEKLQQAGAGSVEDIAVYETRIASGLPQEVADAIAGGAVDWITFTSSSTAKNFVALLGDAYHEKFKDVRIASIGPVTTQSLKELGLEPTVQADQSDLAGLVAAVLSYSK